MEPFTIFVVGKLAAMALKGLAGGGSPSAEEESPDLLTEKFDNLKWRYSCIDWEDGMKGYQKTEEHIRKLEQRLNKQERLVEQYRTLQHSAMEIDWHIQSPRMPLNARKIKDLERDVSYTLKWHTELNMLNNMLPFFWKQKLPSLPYHPKEISAVLAILKENTKKRNTLIRYVVYSILFISFLSLFYVD